MPKATTKPTTITQPTRQSSRLRSAPHTHAPKSGAPLTGSGQKCPTKKAIPIKADSTEDTEGETADDQSSTQDPTSTDNPMDVDGSSPSETDPAKINQPISTLVHRSLTSAWQINRDLPMCFIFDSVSPARRFKRGMLFNEEADFPEYSDHESGNVTETDVPPGLMPYLHDEYKQKYNFKCKIRLTTFMSWTEGELRTIEFGTWRKRRGKSSYTISFTKYRIPAPYDRIVSQLIVEMSHAEINASHEARRRGTYAAKVLDAFGDEIKASKALVTRTVIDKATGYTFPATFRSKVLTPILQRQRLGIHDAYTPFVCDGIGHKTSQLSIQDVTAFYLKADPADPIHIHSYHRNTFYQPEVRWHLGVLMGMGDGDEEKANEHYHTVRANHDRIMASLQDDSHRTVDDRGVFLLNDTEIEVIITEGIQAFFEEELHAVSDRVAIVMDDLATSA